MALTPSNLMTIGTLAPDFSLLDTVSEKILNLQEIKGQKGTIVLFICNHCPFVIHVNKLLVQLAKEYQSKGIAFIAISSNDIKKYPQDGPELMKIHAKENEYPFPYLFDETQEVAKAYNAACTPDIFLFDENLKLHYQGQLDNSRPGNGIPTTGDSIKEAFVSLLQNKSFMGKMTPSIGCNIKWI